MIDRTAVRSKRAGRPLLVLLALVAVLAVATPAGVAEAHALLVRADPPVNAQLRTSPQQLTLYFSEAIERALSSVRVLDGERRPLAVSIQFDDRDDALMRVNLAAAVPPGFYSVAWENVSKVDGHRITGAYPITVLNPDGGLPPGAAIGATAEVSGGEAKPLPVVAKWLLLIAGVLLTGALVYAVWAGAALERDAGEQRQGAVAPLWRRALITALVAAAVLATAGAIEILARARDLGGFGEVGQVLDTTWGGRWLWRNLLLLPLAALLLAAWLRREDARRRLLACGALVAVLGYFGLTSASSHGAAGNGAFWAAAADMLHLAATSVWVGMLFQLFLSIRWAGMSLARGARGPVVATLLQRFSVVAVGSIALLLVSGVFSALVELGNVSDLIDSGYGRALLVKLVLLLPLLGAGAANAYLFRPAFVIAVERGGGRRADVLGELERLLRRTIRLEIGVAAAVLLVVAVLVQLAPPRAGLGAPATAAGKFIESAETQDLSATLVIDPNEPGENTFEVYLTGDAVSVERVRLVFEKEGATSDFESHLILEPSNPPTFYVGRGPFLAQGGTWKVSVDLRRSRGSDVSLPFKTRVIGPGGAVGEERESGSFEWPLPSNAIALGLLGGSLLAAATIVYGSRARPGLAGGYLGVITARLARVELRPGVSLAVLVVVGVGMGLLLGSHLHSRLSPQEAREGNPVESSAASIDRGRQLFGASCAVCHGETGRGDGPAAVTLSIRPANLYEHIPFHPDQFFVRVITNGLSGVMPAFGSQISEEDRWNILNFLRDQFGQPAATQ